MSSDDLWIGIDLGTQSVKVIIVNNKGKICSQSSQPLDSFRDGPIHEQDPNQWIKQTKISLQHALSKVDTKKIRAISTCSTSGTIAVFNKSKGLFSTAIMYDDQRAKEFTQEIIDADINLWVKLGYQIQPSWALPKTLQLFREKKINQEDLIIFQTDVISTSIAETTVATDWSSALKSGYDLINLTWPKEVFRKIGINLGNLPEVVPPGTIIGESGKSWQEETGLPFGTKIVSGLTDGCAAQIGAGALNSGDWHSVMGTTLVLKGVSNKPIFDSTGAIYSHKAPHDDLWFPGGASSAGAGIITDILPKSDLDALNVEVQAEWNKGIKNWAVTYPLNKTGERFPIINSSFSGFSVLRDQNVKLEVSKLLDSSQVLGSIFIGVAAVEKLCFEKLESKGAVFNDNLTSSGGGVKSEVWIKIRSTMLNKNILIPNSAETALGVAILARYGSTKGTELAKIAREMNSIIRTVEPDISKVSETADYYEKFKSKLEEIGII